MICKLLRLTSGVLIPLVALVTQVQATTITFGLNSSGAVPANNSDINPTYGSNVAAATAAFTDSGEGLTPNIALTWAPTGGPENTNDPTADVLEFHSAVTFTNVAGPAFTAPVLQLDVDASNHNAGFLPVRPRIDFAPDPGYAVKIHGLKIGNATDQTETAHPWTLNILALPSLTQLATYTTASLAAGNSEQVTFNYTGTVGQSLRLELSDGNSTVNADHHPRTAIDNLQFSQVVPEPSTIALAALCGLGVALASRRSR